VPACEACRPHRQSSRSLPTVAVTDFYRSILSHCLAMNDFMTNDFGESHGHAYPYLQEKVIE
jgi:hypothetical protein